MKRKKILVCCELESHLRDVFSAFERKFDFEYCDYNGKEEIRSIIGGFQGLVSDIRQCVDRNLIDAAEKLEVIATPSTGTDHIDVDYAESRGIKVQSLKKDYDFLKTVTATAEHAFLLMFASLRNLPSSFDHVKEGGWDRNKFIGRELQGLKVGIVGYGRLGEIFSRLAMGFDMKIYTCDPFKTVKDPRIIQLDYDKLAATVDVITIHVHLTDDTRNMFGKREFDMMKDGMCLVNTSLGALIDETAFLNALISGKVKYAGIDVLATELEGVISKNPLVQYARTHDNLIITPHIGGCTFESQQKAFKHMLEKLTVFFHPGKEKVRYE
ncbi:MAG: NAD(P)-dependent oxidoreductase [Lentisphaerota bacterium]